MSRVGRGSTADSGTTSATTSASKRFRGRAGRSANTYRRWRHSLRARLITVFLLLALVMAAIFISGMQRAFSFGWREAARPLVADYLERLVADLGSPPDPTRAQALVDRLPISIRISGPSVNWSSRPDHSLRDDGGFGPRGADWLSRTTADGHRVSFGLARLSWRRGSDDLGIVTLVLLLLTVIGAYAYVRRLLRPLDDIRAGANRFGSGRFDEPIPLRKRDELGDLAQRINKMAHDIEGMLDAKRTLLLALSHELRSPLTRARLNAELLPTDAHGHTEREALLRDLNEMRDLITDLLESERLASPHAALNREPVDLAALVREVIADIPSSNNPGVALDLQDHLPTLQLDRTRIRLLVRNLLDNALRYGADATEPARVSLRSAPAAPGIVLEVRDYGPGVEDSKLERLTEPFYRTDTARQRTTGGVGLGLYLCRLVAQAHGGQMTASNASPGLRIVVSLA